MTVLAGSSPVLPDGVRTAQATFRSVMDALARPGTVRRLPATIAPRPVMSGAAAIALSLFDHDTPVWLDPGIDGSGEIVSWLKFHTGAPIIADTASASFALVSDGRLLPQLEGFALGTSEYPDRSTTVILQVGSLDHGRTVELRGPGINGATRLTISADPADLFERLVINATLFPRGIDLLLVRDDQVVAIPRTTRLTAIGG